MNYGLILVPSTVWFGQSCPRARHNEQCRRGPFRSVLRPTVDLSNHVFEFEIISLTRSESERDVAARSAGKRQRVRCVPVEFSVGLFLARRATTSPIRGHASSITIQPRKLKEEREARPWVAARQRQVTQTKVCFFGECRVHTNEHRHDAAACLTTFALIAHLEVCVFSS